MGPVTLLLITPSQPSSLTLNPPPHLCTAKGVGGAGLGWAELFHAWRPPCSAGTSSILAGTALAALQRAAGRMMDTKALIHAVLHLEQVLTTGMGLPLVGGRSLALSQGPPGAPLGLLTAPDCAAPSSGWSFLLITLTFSAGFQLAMFLPQGS